LAKQYLKSKAQEPEVKKEFKLKRFEHVEARTETHKARKPVGVKKEEIGNNA